MIMAGTSMTGTPRRHPSSCPVPIFAARTLLAAAVAVGSVGIACAAPDQVALPGDRVFPESLTSTSDGTLFIGSFAEGGILKVKPGADKAEAWIKPGANNSRSTFGVLADEKSNTLLVCSNDTSGFGVPGPSGPKGSALKAFDLTTGAAKGSTPLPGDATLCNDIALGLDGSAYVTDSFNPHILRLRPGGHEFEVWANDPRFGAPRKGAGLDGIAIGSDGAVYVNTFTPGGLFKVAVADGKAGEVTTLQTSRKITLPDSLRSYGNNKFLMIEGAGSLDLVTIDGGTAKIETIKDGFSGPVSVTQVGSTAWVAEGQLGHLLDPKLKKQPPKLPFHLYAVPLPPP
jgi:sugar lactone lactonase YvrE